MVIVMFLGAIAGVVFARFFNAYAIVLASLAAALAIVAYFAIGHVDLRRAFFLFVSLQIGIQGGALLAYFVAHFPFRRLSSGLKAVSLRIARR